VKRGEPHRMHPIQAIYIEQKDRLYTYAVSITRHRQDAEDAIHAVCARLLQSDSLPEDPVPYLYRCIRNAAIDQLRRARRRKELPLFDLADDKEAMAAASGYPAVEALAEALNELDPLEREIIVLRIYSRCSYREISQVLDTPLNTVSSRYRRSLAKLRTILGERPHE